MKKNVLLRLRWWIDAAFLVALAWAFGVLSGIVVGVPSLRYEVYGVPSSIVMFPLLVGLLVSIIFAFMSIKFHPSREFYILICAILVILPTLPSLVQNSSFWAQRGVNVLYFGYLALSMLLSDFIYQRIRSISNATSSPSQIL